MGPRRGMAMSSLALGVLIVAMFGSGSRAQQQVIDWSVTLNAGGFDQQSVMNCTTPMQCQNVQGQFLPTMAASDSTLGNWPPNGEFMFRNGLEARHRTVFLRNITMYAFMWCCSLSASDGRCTQTANDTRVRAWMGDVLVFDQQFYPTMNCDP